MHFFDLMIDEVYGLISGFPSVHLNVSADLWKELSHSEVILQRDSAFELNGTGFNLLTSNDVRDEIIVLGDDISDIKKSCCFTRISLIGISPEADEQKYYSLIKKTEYIKYHYFPEGFMLRSTSSSNKESIRVSKNAVKNGIDFQKTGSMLVNKYKKIPEVKSAAVIYFTHPDIDYNKLNSMAYKTSKISETLNHVVNSVNFDCDSCNLKAVCDEVDGMRKLHFRICET